MQIKTPASLTVWHLNGKDESQNKTTKNNRKMTKTAFPIGKIVFDIVTLLWNSVHPKNIFHWANVCFSEHDWFNADL